MTPLVSIIMPLFNAERYVAQSIESVLAQTYTNWELLVSDDHSTDNSVEIVKSFVDNDKRIKLFESEKNQGIAMTRNISIEHAKGRFVAFLDNDDIWMPEKLEKQLKFMLDKNCGFSYTSYELVDNKGVSKNKIIKTIGILDYKKYSRNTIIGCGTVMLDSDIVGDFRMPLFGTSDDMALWLNILRRGVKAYPVEEVLQKYRVTKNSASSNKINAARDVWRVYRENEQMPWLKAVYCFSCYAFHAVKKRLF